MNDLLSNRVTIFPVPVLARALRVIERIAHGDGDVRSVQALGRELGLAQATCYRIVRTLEQAGWLALDGEGVWRLGEGLRTLTGSGDVRKRMARIAEPVLRDVADDLRLSCKVTLRIGDEAVTVARAESDAPYRISSSVGGRFSLCTGSSGAMLLRDVPCDELERLIALAPNRVWKYQTPDDFRKRVAEGQAKGVTLDRGQYHPDVYGLSVPVEYDSDLLAALTVMAMPSGLPDKKVPSVKRRLTRAAKAIEAKWKEW